MKYVLLAFTLLYSVASVSAADVVLLREGASDYQIVVPDQAPTPALSDCLQQTARLMQCAFQANGVEVDIVAESQRDAAKPTLYLGETQFARRQGIDVTGLRDWSYVHRVVGRDVIIAGRDFPAQGETDNARRPNWDRVGTAKAVVDFVRQYMGVRFLYPEIPSYTPVSGAAKIDLLASPALEFLPMKTMSAPGDLNVLKTPVLRVNTSHPAGGGFYDLAHNRFPRVDESFGGHTWERAVPAELFADHPEYFALINGQRLQPEGGKAQYCLSNPEVQERIYRDLASLMDRGFAAVDLGQPDGYRECQCEDCAKLYDTGDNWSEKIWIFHRNVAERLEKSHPGRQVTMMSYILTALPPKTFRQFPANTSIMLTGTNEEDIAPWRDIVVPRGFTGYVYNWCPNLGTRYTPMRTPGFVESQVKRLAANKVQALYRDGPGQLFGLEGPVYYVMGRMFDDPEQNAAKDLLPEFCDAAFRDTSTAFYMRSFYDQLYHAITLYSDHIGTRCDAWTYQSIDGRRRKTVQDPFQLIAFLYPPGLLASLDADLKQAERLAKSPKVKTRLALVRKEFEYLRHFARVVHLHQAFQVAPDAALRDRLLDAIDARNAFIATLFEKPRTGATAENWPYVLFPFPGHDEKHLRLAYDGYQEPYAHTCFNWNTQALRTAPTPGKKQVSVVRAEGPVTLDAAQWRQTTPHELTIVPPLRTLPRKTTLRLLYDATNLYLLAECELEPDGPTEFPKSSRDRSLADQEAVDVYFQPQAAQEVFYRIAVGPNAAAKYDAINGLVTDPLDPRYGKDDPAWNGQWEAESHVDGESHRWRCLITVPFAALNTEAPSPGVSWRANFARYHLLPRGRVDRSIWSSTIASTSMDDRSTFGVILFE